MATQLKDLQFNDYTIKGKPNDGNGKNYLLGGTTDALTYEYTAGSGGSAHTVEAPIIDHSWSLGCSTVWHFHGGADCAGYAVMVDVHEGGDLSEKFLYGTKIPAFSKSGSSATIEELENWITTFVNEFSGGSTYVIAGTYYP